MQVFTDYEMLAASIPTTNDGCNIIRSRHSILFEALFTQVPAVMQSFPFTIDMAFMCDTRLVLSGQLDS